MDLDKINMRVSEQGFCVRGAFNMKDHDQTAILIGNIGGDLWPHFSPHQSKTSHPLDQWTKKVLQEIATDIRADVYFPFEGPPFHPFQKWAQQAEQVFPSPIGPLIHPTYGLWHAYRALFVFKDKQLLEEKTADLASPCLTCLDKPCLHTCPVSAFNETSGYDVPKCIAHLKTPEGQDCMAKGCIARRACPVGKNYIYPPQMAKFHMEKFVEINGK
ncbi:MAG: ferredoxin [Rhodospirillales bacterium]|nr:ferredoxin [Rhodospirillales bacterium]